MARDLADGVLAGVVEDHRHVEPATRAAGRARRRRPLATDRHERALAPGQARQASGRRHPRSAARPRRSRSGRRRACRGGSPSRAARPRCRSRCASRSDGPCEALQGRIRASLLRPARKDAREERRARAVRVLVERDRQLLARLLEHLEQPRDHPLVGERLQMRDVERGARAARDVEHLADRVEQAGALVADVRNDRDSGGSRFLGDGDQLVGPGVRPGEVDEPEREHARAGVDRSPYVRAHLAQLRRRRGHVGRADDEVADRAVRGGRDEGRRRSRPVERSEVLLDALPRPLVRAGPLERAEVVASVAPPVSGDGRRSEPVRADHLGREALRELRDLQRVDERRERRVGVEVDEPRAEEQPVAVDLCPCSRAETSS